MTGPQHFPPPARCLFAATAVLCWALTPVGRLAAQPSNPPPVLAATTNADEDFQPPTKLDRFNYVLATARFEAGSHDFAAAEMNFVKLLAEDVPEDISRSALFELGQLVQSENDLARAQAIFTQYLQRWPGDSRAPEVCLHQGQIFRQMGLVNLALAKFYSVMTTALSLKNDQLPFYKRLVLEAQVEIAETHYLAGKFKDAADYYSRLLAQNDPSLDRAQIQFRLIRSFSAIAKHDATANQAQDFLSRYPDSTEVPEVRYHLAEALKGQNRTAEALQQVLVFLKEERASTKDRPEVWAYWQQRVGNEIGNQLYQEGDYVKALQVYLALAKLDSSPAWQLPVRYQVGLTYEKLLQPALAIEAYRSITKTIPDLGGNLTPDLQSVVDMAGWRLNYLAWQVRADDFNRTPKPAATNHLNLTQR